MTLSLKLFTAGLILILALVFTGFNPANHPVKEENSIEWSESRKLKWSDFKDSPPRYTSNVALTSYRIKMTYLIEEDEIWFIVKCEFIGDDSWVRRWGMNDYILNHEQKHFDLAEIHARKLRKKLSETSFKGVKLREVDKIINRFYAEVWDECGEAQILYDEETDHSINKRSQSVWDEKISDGLSTLNKYSKPKFISRK